MTKSKWLPRLRPTSALLPPSLLLLVVIFLLRPAPAAGADAIFLDPAAAKSLSSLDNSPHSSEGGGGRVLSRKKRTVIFPTGSTLAFDVGLDIPIAALDATSTTFDIVVPFSYNLPNSTSNLYFSGRKMEEDHAAIFEMAEDLLSKFGINGKSCILRLICELAESGGLKYNGLLGKAIETLFLIDYSLSSTERLYEYISARTYGEHSGNCYSAYPQCPFSAFNVMENTDLSTLSNLV